MAEKSNPAPFANLSITRTSKYTTGLPADRIEAHMTTITFDTLKFVERLKAAGVPEEQAKAEVEALSEALSETIAVRELATKTDLEAMKSDLIKWMAGLLLAQAAVVATLVKLL